jgi:hypothetical protein
MNLLPADWTLNVVILGAIAAALAMWQALAARHDDLVSFGDLVGLARQHLLTRWLLLAAWAWLGWHLVVRTHY